MSVLNKINQQKLSLLLDKPWLLPSLLVLIINFIGIALSLGIENIINSPYLSISEDKQQTILNILASSLMTLISVTFSISMLILSTVSNQFGPRLLPNFIHSKNTQITLGIFLGTFLYCLFCIYSETNTITRGAQTIYAFILALGCITILVAFVNNVMKSIQIDGILSLIISQTKSAISSIQQENTANSHKSSELKPRKIIKSVSAGTNGYIQGIDYKKLKTIACENNIFLQVNVRSGDYVYHQDEVIIISAEDEKTLEKISLNTLQSTINIISIRLLKQDVEYGFEQISEIAVRALSPGINDPYTARDCVFLLGELFLYLEHQDHIELSEFHYQDKILLAYRSFTYQGIVEAGLNRLRQAALSDLTVILAIYDMIIQITALLKNKKLISALLKQGIALHDMIQNKNLPNYDRLALSEREETLHNLVNQYQSESFKT
ncbi:DUF2254 domain-containing protein [Legionella nagasakiensis]|uniref:DUF2254 domain-containing protein n=1 Tax=Legionella nagasakiensis TaxID=535290 RepID=UPI001056A916|nr:DUF2254 domain-containing protein [Legionella nagasakiensis]